MNPVECYQLLITPLARIHIGTGDSYEPTNYVIENDALYEFDLGDSVQLLQSRDRDGLRKIVDQRPGEDMIKSVQRFFYERRQTFIPNARKTIRVLEGVAELYRKRLGSAAQIEADGSQVINRLEIDRTASNPITHLPVLFGSSLKGAVRTALLDYLNKGRALQGDEKNLEFQERIFAYRRGKFELDPLRLVQFSDASWQGPSDLPASEVCLAVNRKKETVFDSEGRPRRSQAEQRGLCQILECVPPLHYRVFKGQLNIQNVGDLEVRNKLPKPSLRFDVKTIVRACNAFYKPILMKENRMLAERGFLSESWRAGIEALLAGEIGERMNRDGAFLVRVGRHSGAESVTVSGVRKIRIMRGKGQKDEYAASAKTVWLAASDLAQEENMLPFGWLLVEVYPTGDVKLEECEVLKRICDRYTEPVKTWAGKQLQIRRQAAEKLMQRQREQELLAEKQREEAERAARLAAMSLEERVIEKLRALFEEEKATGHKDPAGSLANQRVELLRQAKGWQSPELREKAAGLIEETLQWLDWPKKKREERNREIQELRGNATGGD